MYEAVDEKKFDALEELRDRTLVYVLAYSGFVTAKSSVILETTAGTGCGGRMSISSAALHKFSGHLRTGPASSITTAVSVGPGFLTIYSE